MGIRVENVTRGFEGNIVLDDLSLDIPTGAFASIVAPTGSGKTTLLRIMAGIDFPDDGRIYYDDEDVTDVEVQRRSIAMVYQEFINYPSLTVYENIASPLRVARNGKRYTEEEIDEKVRQVARLLRIEPLLQHYPEEVSGGEKQRTAIARSLIKGSRYIFLDEPLANLDYKLREELRTEFKTVFTGVTLVYATPEPVDALAMSTHIGFLHEGKIIQFGTADEVYRFPRFVEVGYYFSSPPMNIFPAELVKDGKKTFLQVTEDLRFPADAFRDDLDKKEYLLGIRPQDLHDAKLNKDMISFSASIEFTEVVGAATSLHLAHEDLNFGMTLETTIKRFERGRDMEAYFDPQHIFVYDKDTRELMIAWNKPVTWPEGHPVTDEGEES